MASSSGAGAPAASGSTGAGARSSSAVGSRSSAARTQPSSERPPATTRVTRYHSPRWSRGSMTVSESTTSATALPRSGAARSSVPGRTQTRRGRAGPPVTAGAVDRGAGSRPTTTTSISGAEGGGAGGGR